MSDTRFVSAAIPPIPPSQDPVARCALVRAGKKVGTNQNVYLAAETDRASRHRSRWVARRDSYPMIIVLRQQAGWIGGRCSVSDFHVVASAGLGGVHRGVGCRDERVAGVLAAGGGTDAHAGAARSFSPSCR